MGLPQMPSDIVRVTVVLAVYPIDAPLLPATEKLPHEPGVVVVVVSTRTWWWWSTRTSSS